MKWIKTTLKKIFKLKYNKDFSHAPNRQKKCNAPIALR